MQPKALEPKQEVTVRSFSFYAGAELLERIEQYMLRVEEQTGVRLTRSQATAALVRRGLDQMVSP